MLKALLHPFGLTLLLASLVLAGLVLSVLDRWSGEALWIVLLGVLAYAASVAAVGWRWPGAPLAASRIEIGDRLVHRALRGLDKPAALSKSELVALLPATLASSRSQEDGLGAPGELAPLEKAQALHEVLNAAIERLKIPGEPTGIGAPGPLQYHILHEAYVRRRPVAYILTRYSISEKTYHRNRSDAESAVAHHLQSQEESIRTGGAKAAETG